MKAINEMTIKDLVEESPNLIEYFEIQGIDYCCGGNQSLQEAIEAKELEALEVVTAVNEILNNSAQQTTTQTVLIDPAFLSISSLIQYITDKHHRYTRVTLDQLEGLTQKIAHVQGSEHPELIALRDVFAAFKGELTKHLQKEELFVFPSLKKLEQSTSDRKPTTAGRTIEELWKDLGDEHQETGEVLLKFHKLTDGFTPPIDACDSYQRTFGLLKDLSQDIHMHVYLEENVLLTKAQKLYESL